MSRIKHTMPAVILHLLAAVACAGEEGTSRAEAWRDEKLGPAEEQKLLELPEDRTLVHEKVSATGRTLALWVRRPESIQLLVTDRPGLDFKGHVGFQEGLSFHVVQPRGDSDIHIAGSGAEEDSWLVWGPSTGISGEPLDDYFVISDDDAHLLYAVYDKGRWCWVLDDGRLADYHRLITPVLGGGGIAAWITGDEGEQRVVVDGEPGSLFDSVYESSLEVSPDGRHVSYVAERSGKRIVVRDGVEHSSFASVDRPLTSPDGRRMAYVAENEYGKSVVVLDGTPGPQYEAAAALTFSEDGSRFGHRANEESRAFFVIDGRAESARFEDLANVLVFAPRGKRYAYAGIRGENWYVVVDGKEGDACTGVFGTAFSPDGERFAKGEIPAEGKMEIWVDGKKRWAHEGQPARRLAWSPDGSRVFYAVRRDSRVVVAVDGEEGPPCAAVGGLTFSADGSRMAYIAREESGRTGLYVDGEKVAEHEAIVGDPAFTRSGELAYCVYEEEKWRMVVGGVPGKAYDRIYLPPARGEPMAAVREDGSLDYLARDGDHIVRVRHAPVGK